MTEKGSLVERRANALAGEMEEARALLDSAERGKKQTEAELGEARNAVNDMTGINTRAATEKRGLEGNVHTMQVHTGSYIQEWSLYSLLPMSIKIAYI